MQQIKSSRRDQRISGQQAAGRARLNLLKECDALRAQVKQLNEKLDAERVNCFTEKNRRIQLNKALDETRDNLQKQKTLKEMYINKGKETRRDLERLRKYSDTETLSITKIATQVRDNTKRKKKKLLQVDYEELQVAHIISEKKFKAELDVVMEQNNFLQKELENITALYNEVSLKYQAEVVTVQQQPETLQSELELYQKQYEEFNRAYVLSEQKFTAELQTEREQSNFLRQELEKITASHYEVSLNYQTDVVSVRQQAETLQCELQRFQSSYEELKAFHILSQQKFTAELNEERKTNKTLREEVEKITASHHAVSLKYEADVISVRQQTETLQHELDKQIKTNADTVAEGWKMINNLRAVEFNLRQKMEEEINTLKQNALEKESIYARELEELKTQLNVQISLNLELSTALEAEEENGRPPRKISKSKENQEDEPCEDQQSFPAEPTVQPPDEDQVSEENTPTTPKTPSVWKKTRHFLGLRKPQRWKK